MTTRAQRLQRQISEKRGVKFALERAVLNAARALMGSVRKYGCSSIPVSTWQRFIKAETALHDHHAARNRRVDSGKATP